ncbi:hypothetical protein O3M35_001170 [Rhynocoris fuscipes]|uniref:Peptidase C2 calpain domain-containing protein n=1 Tax=Rhynocoris fuscipes TaxID=488301 RepID=A0AAW1DQB2_9HEMI
MYCSGNYQLAELNGEWKAGITAGGSRNDLELFSTNPQFLLSVGPKENHRTSVESYYSEENKFNKIMVSICLEQNQEKPLSHVAYFIYKTDKEERLSAEYFLVVPPEGDTGAFVNWRQLRHEFRLSPGLYVIIPATFLPNIVRKFTLTIQTFPPFYLKELPNCDQSLQ